MVGGKERGGGEIECLKAQIHDSCQYQGPKITPEIGLYSEFRSSLG